MRTLRPFPALQIAAAVAACAMLTGLSAQAADKSPSDKASAKAADRAVVAAAFGNTVVSAYPDGTSQKIWLHSDGSWTGLSRRNSPLAGNWSVKGEKVCLRQSQPPTLPVSYCTALPASSQPGVQWTGRDVAGRSITLSLMKGMPAQHQGGQYQTSQAHGPSSTR